MECRKEENLNKCPCTWDDCQRKGVCCLCLPYHLEKGELPACCFSAEGEKTYDRSIGHFIEDRQKEKRS